MVSASTPQLWSQQGPHFSSHSTTKTNDKSTLLRLSGVSDVVIASVQYEKTCLRNLIMMMIMIIIIITQNHLLVNKKRRCSNG